MAITRTVLPRKGLVQPQHGITQYESDMDANLSILDANVAYMSDLASVVDTLVGDIGLNGVVAGSNSPLQTRFILPDEWRSLCQRLALCARRANTGAAPANATSYLFYQEENWPNSYYYRAVPTSLNPGDAFIGIVVANDTQVTGVTQAMTVFGQIPVTPTTPGNFTVPHLLGRVPVGHTSA